MEKLILEDEDGVEVVIPSRFDVCSRCEGKGTHDHPAFANGISGEDFNGPDWDEDSREDYIRGAYDVPCSQCNGLRVELVADEDRMTDEMKALWEAHSDRQASYRAEEANERRMGY